MSNFYLTEKLKIKVVLTFIIMTIPPKAQSYPYSNDDLVGTVTCLCSPVILTILPFYCFYNYNDHQKKRKTIRMIDYCLGYSPEDKIYFNKLFNLFPKNYWVSKPHLKAHIINLIRIRALTSDWDYIEDLPTLKQLRNKILKEKSWGPPNFFLQENKSPPPSENVESNLCLICCNSIEGKSLYKCSQCQKEFCNQCKLELYRLPARDQCCPFCRKRL